MSGPGARPLEGRFRIRQAAIEDLPALAAMKAQAWRQTYDLPASFLNRLAASSDRTAEHWAAQARQGTYFWGVVDTQAPETDQPAWVGIAQACPARDHEAPESLELAMMYLLDEAKGSGIADRLLQMAVGDAPAYLWVLEGNGRAIRFYARHGFEADGVRRPLPNEFTEVWEQRLVRRAL